MTDSYHFQTLNRGEMEVCADGGVRWCGYYSGDRHSLTAAEVRGRGFDSAEEFVNRANSLNSYKIIRASIGPFGSGATLKTSGDKIVGRVSGTLAGVKVTVGAGGYSGVTLVSGGGSGGSGRAEPTQTEADVSQAIETILNSPMKRRDNLPPAPLPHFNQRTEFDAFPDFVVFHEFEPVAPLHTSPTTDSAYPAIAGLLRG